MRPRNLVKVFRTLPGCLEKTKRMTCRECINRAQAVMSTIEGMVQRHYQKTIEGMVQRHYQKRSENGTT